MGDSRPAFASSREQFAKAVIDEIRGYEGIASATYGGGFEVVYERRNGSRGTVALSGLYQRFGGATGPELSQVIADQVESTLADDDLGTTEDVFMKGGAGKPESSQPRQFSLGIAGYGVEAQLRLPVGIVPLENGALLFSNMSPAQVTQRGPENLQNALLTPGKPPAGALEMRQSPGRPFVTYSSGEEGTTELALGVGMDSYGGLLAVIRAADHPAHWTIVTDDYEIRWPAGFTLTADGDLNPRSWPYEFGLDAEHLLYLQGPLTGLEQIPLPDELVAPGMELIDEGAVEGTHVIWFELAYDHGGGEWRQRFYYVPFASESIYALRAQATEAVAAEMFEAADLIATSFRPRG